MKTRYVLALLFASSCALAADPASQVSIVPQFGAQLPPGLMWHDERGNPTSLGSLTSGHPSLLVLAYYRCPMLCPRVLQGLAATLRGSGIEKESGLHIVVTSIDPRDTSTVARGAQQQFVDRSQIAAEMVHFLTGPAASSKSLAAAVGIHYAYDAAHGEYAHPAEYILTDKEGRVSRYLPAFTTTALDLRLALADTEAGKRTSIWDHALLLCYAYDPVSGRYTFAITAVLRAAGILTVLAIAALFWRHRRRRM